MQEATDILRPVDYPTKVVPAAPVESASNKRARSSNNKLTSNKKHKMQASSPPVPALLTQAQMDTDLCDIFGSTDEDEEPEVPKSSTSTHIPPVPGPSRSAGYFGVQVVDYSDSD